MSQWGTEELNTIDTAAVARSLPSACKTVAMGKILLAIFPAEIHPVYEIIIYSYLKLKPACIP